MKDIGILSIGGMGGFELGMDRATVDGFVARMIIEPSKSARAILRYQFPKTIIADDYAAASTYKRSQKQLQGAIGIICARFGAKDRIYFGDRERVERGPSIVHVIRDLAASVRPEWILIEAPADLCTSGRGRGMQAFIALFTGGVPEVPRGGWRSAGLAPASDEECYTAAWRVLDLRCFFESCDTLLQRALVQERRRTYIVLARGARGIAEILLDEADFEGVPESLGTEAGDAGLAARCEIPNAVIPFVWRAGGFANSPIVERDTLPPIHGDNVAIATARAMRPSHDDYPQVRRLMPEEVEMAFGFPEDYTAAGLVAKGTKMIQKAMGDTPRYDAMKRAVPPAIVAWITSRIPF